MLKSWMHTPQAQAEQAATISSMAQRALERHLGEIPVSGKLRVFSVPVRLALEKARCLNDLRVIERTSDELYAPRQTVLAEAARHADSRKSAHVADAANGIGKRQLQVEVGINFVGGHGQRGGGQNVHLGEEF